VVLSANVTIPGGVVRANEFFGALRNQLGQH
jgi:hypothetical protein